MRLMVQVISMMLAALLATAFLMYDNIKEKPAIYEIGTESIRDETGWVIIYRYAVNGLESTVILNNEEDLRSYKLYLAEFGTFNK